MGDTTRTIVIKAKNEASSGLRSVANDFQRLDGDISKVTKSFDIIKNSLVVGLGIGAAKAVASFVGSCVNEFADFERNALKLSAAFQGNKQALSSISSFMEELGSKSNSTNDEIEALVSELAVLGKSPKEIEKLTTAANILAEATGQSLQGAFTQLNATFTGSAGKLSKLIPELGNLTEQQLKAGAATDIVISSMGTFTDSVAGSYSVKVKNLSEAFKDLKQQLGEGWAEAFKPIIDGATTAIKKLAELSSSANVFKKFDDVLGNRIKALDPDKESVDQAKLQELRFSMTKDEFASLLEKYLKGGGGVMANPALVAFAKSMALIEDKVEKIIPSTTSTTTTGATGKPKVDPEKAWNDFLESIDLGFREINSGIDDVVKEALVDADKPSSKSSSVDSLLKSNGSGLSKEVSGGFDLFGGQSMDVGSLLTEALGSGGSMAALAPAIAPLIASFEALLGPMALLIPVVEGFVGVISPAIDAVIKPLMTSLTGVGKMLGEVLLPIFDAISPVFAIVGQILTNVMAPVIQLLAPSIAIISGVLSLLTPILKAVAVAFEVVMAPVKWVADLFKWIATTIKTAVQNFVEVIEHPFDASKRVNGTYTEFTSEAFTGLGDRIAAIWDTNYSTSLATTGVGNTGTAANYNTSGDIIQNIYLYGTVVGEGGMKEFAYMLQDINDERRALNR